jgi:membrane associated rhomboid family serine protease
VLSVRLMRAQFPLSRAASFPVTVGVALLAIAATAFYWSGRDVTPMLMQERAYFSQPWRLLTSTLLHADVFHLAFNVYWLWVFGTVLEAQLGALRFLGLSVALAVLSGSAQFAIGSGAIGLSGIGYGLLGFLWGARRRQARFADAVNDNTVALFGAWFVLCVVLTRAKVWNIGNVAHATGALAGLVASVVLTRDSPKPRQLPKPVGWLGLATLLVLCLLSATTLRPRLNRDADAGLEVGVRAYEALTAQRNVEAIALFERALKLTPSEPTLWFNLGIAYQREQRLDEASRAYQRAAQLDPGSSTYREAAEWQPAHPLVAPTAN